jgi:copper chaperone CopZ
MNIRSLSAQTSTVFRIEGMSCDHCAAAVAAEIGAVAGVGSVQVDLAAGTATATSGRPLERAAVAAAVYEAGCTLA